MKWVIVKNIYIFHNIHIFVDAPVYHWVFRILATITDEIPSEIIIPFWFGAQETNLFTVLSMFNKIVPLNICVWYFLGLYDENNVEKSSKEQNLFEKINIF